MATAARRMSFFMPLWCAQKAAPRRLSITHVLEKPPKAWKGETGRLDRAMFARLLDGMLARVDLGDLEVYTCGPEPVMAAVSDEMLARGLAASRLHQEKFTPPLALPMCLALRRKRLPFTRTATGGAAPCSPGKPCWKPVWPVVLPCCFLARWAGVAAAA
jgi:ferredoxin-NADP reductase